MNNLFKKSMAFIMSITMVFGLAGGISTTAKADATIESLGSGSIGNGVTNDIGSVAAKLPTLANSGTIRYTTDNYNKNNGAFDTNNWGTCGMWDYFGTATYTGSIYTYPMAYRASEKGMGFAHPATRVGGTYVVNTLTPNGTFTDFFVQPEFSTSCSKVDNITDWTYDMVLENKDDSSQYLKTTMTQGSPFGFFQLYKSKTVNLVRNNTSMKSSIAYYNGTTLANSTYVVLKTYKVYDTSSIKDQEDTPDYDYYGVYVPTGTTWEQSGNSSTNIGNLKLNLPSEDKAYFSIAWLAESDGSDTEALSVAKEYQPFAYNFIKDTKATYSYDEASASLKTTYNYIVDRKAESTKDGTIMGIMPHQYKNIDDTVGYLSHTARTLRGTVKYRMGSNFTTNLKFSGVLPSSPNVAKTDESQLSTYVSDFISKYMPDGGNYSLCVDESAGDPYALGKQLNRSTNVMAAAESVGDSSNASKILKGLEKEMANWFTYTGSGDGKYFTYDGDIGSLLSFPTSYDSISQMNDHYFHYGYFIQAAAQVGLRDSNWLDKYGKVVEELIGDIACTDRNSSTSRYPYLRNFSPFEGHSWASGFEDPECGNNQESTSEAMNAWYGIILYGIATGNTEIRDLGIYLYTTELSGIENYWFDVDGDVLDEKFDDSHIMASLIFGGKYDYATWFSGDRAMVQGIQLLPITAGSYYLAMDKDYMSAYTKSGNAGSWNDVWSEYIAMNDPDTGYSNWSQNSVEGGETVAHTYHFIKSLQNYGRPDLSVTSSTPLSMVFNKNGEKTYVVYNSDDSMKTVSFSDGAKFTAAPNTTTTRSASEMQGDEYYVDYYLQQKDGTYKLEGTDIKYAAEGTKVSAEEDGFTGFTLNKNNPNAIASGTVTKSGLTLKLYYDRNSYTINYVLDGGANNVANPTSYTYGDTKSLLDATKENCNFRGWYTDKELTNKITSISSTTDGNLTLYAKWADAGDYYINDDLHVAINGNIATFTMEGESQLNSVIAYYHIYTSESEALTAAANKTVSNCTGVGLDYADGKWTGSTTIGNIVGKYMVVGFNKIGSATDTGLTDFGCFKVTNTGTEQVTTNPGETTTTIPGESTTTKPSEITTTASSGDSIDWSSVSNWTKIGTDSIYYSVISGESAFDRMNDSNSNNFFLIVKAGGFLASINGPKTNNVVTRQCAGAEISLTPSDFATKGYYTISATVGSTDLVVAIRSGEAEEITTQATTTVVTTTEKQTETTTPKPEETTTQQVTEGPTTNVTTSSDIKIEGYQISSTLKGIRVVSSFEPTINGKEVVEHGNIYGLVRGGISKEDLVLGSTNTYIKDFVATSQGTISSKLGDSSTATYYVRTMTMNGSTVVALSAKYYVRAYAKLSDGTYVYSNVEEYSINDVAKKLYDNSIMPTKAGHDYLYNDILKVVDSAYKEVDYNWNNTIVKA